MLTMLLRSSVDDLAGAALLAGTSQGGIWLVLKDAQGSYIALEAQWEAWPCEQDQELRQVSL